MAKIEIQTFLSTADALRIGSTEHGRLAVSPTEGELAALSGEQRTALISYVAGTSRWLSVSRPGWAGVVDGLETARAEAVREAAEREANIDVERLSYRRMKALVEAHEFFEPGSLPPTSRGDLKSVGVHWSGAPNYSKDDAEAKRLWGELAAMRAAEFARIVGVADASLGDNPRAHIVGDGEQAKPSEQVEKLARIKNFGNTTQERERHAALIPRTVEVLALVERIKAEAEAEKKRATAAELRALIAKHGSPDQLERHDAGVLPSAERQTLVKTALFAPLAAFASYDEISEQEVAQELDCELDSVKFSTREVEEFGAADWALLQAIRKAAPDGAKVVAREHVGYQRGHDASDDPEITRLGFRVTVEFAGDKYSREFAAASGAQ